MEVIYAQEPSFGDMGKSIFLLGPTPRKKGVKSWRPDMIDNLKEAHFSGVIYSPEPRGGKWLGDYTAQVKWELKHLEACDLILAWIPRQLPDMPAFTSNVEFGLFVTSGKMLFGYPEWAEKMSYLDWMYREITGGVPFHCSRLIATEAVKKVSLSKLVIG